jgi:hypothetical protein
MCGWLLHNRYTRTDTCVRWGMAVTYSRHKFVAVSLPKRFRNGCFTSETGIRDCNQCFKNVYLPSPPLTAGVP